MNQNEINKINKILSNYEEKKITKLDELKALNKKVYRPVKIFAYVFGSISSLALGTGMCLAMKVIGNSMALGIGIGLIGILLVSINYTLYKKILKIRKRKFQDKILSLSDEILNKN